MREAKPEHLGRYVTGAQPERPATFAARGVAVPFTAPMLAGARLRHGGARAAELVLPALGGRGVYVVDWPTCREVCAPSLHDRQLWQRMAVLPRLVPAALRRAAREVAALGIAGRPASAAARLALRNLEASRTTLRASLAARLGIVATRPGAAPLLDRLTDILVECGLGPPAPGPLGARLAAIEHFAAAVSAWAPTAPTPEVQRGAAVALGAARLTVAAARGCLEAIAPVLADPASLLARGEAGLKMATELAERPDWLIDGWPGICALWEATPAAGRAAALAEIIALLPIPAAEADGWPGPVADWSVVIRGRRVVRARPAWAGGRLLELAQRNEMLRAIAA